MLIATEIEQADSFKEGINAAMIKIKGCMTVHAVAAMPLTPTPSDPCESTSQDRNSMKLLKLTLRQFNGKIIQ